MSHENIMSPPETLREKIVELQSELEHVRKGRDTLRDELMHAAQYRRLDCVRVAQKYLEATDDDSGGLIDTAGNIAHFVETGSVLVPHPAD